MRIGVPTTSYPRFDGDVAGVFVRELCRALVRRGHTCEVIAPDDEDACRLTDVGIDVVRVPHRLRGWPRTFYGAGAPDNVARDRRALLGAVAYSARLVETIRASSARWDATLSQWALPSSAATFLARGAERHVAVWHSADVHLASRLLGGRAWPLLRGSAAQHAFVAAHLRDRIGASVDPSAHVIPMGLTVPSSDVAHPPLVARPLRALVIARLVPIKRVALAIEACAQAPEVELVIAGDGPERDALGALARERGVVTRFPGIVGDAEKRSLFEWADVYLATSGTTLAGSTEGYPVAPREALAHGVVVLATEDEVHRELARRCGEAILLAPMQRLGETLRKLAAAPDRLHALSASARAGVARDDWSDVAERFGAPLHRPFTARRGARPRATAAPAARDRAAPGT